MKGKRSTTYLMWGGLLLYFIAVCVIMAQHVDQHLNSDMSSELLLANVMAADGTLLSSDWYYSTELRLLSIQLLTAPLFRITQDWHTVRVVGNILWYVVLLASAYYFCRQIKLKRYFPLVGILLLFPLSPWYMANILEAVIYIPVVATSFFLFGMILRYMNGRTRAGLLCCICGIGLLSLASGLNGFRPLFVFNMPFVIAALILFFRQRSDKGPPDGRGTRLLTASLVSFLCTCVGCLVNTQVLAKLYTFRSFGDLRFTALSWDGVIRVADYWLSLLGYREGMAFSMTLIYNLLAACMIVLTAVALFRCRARAPLPDVALESKVLALFYAVALALFTALYALTDMDHHPTYLIPVAVFALPLIVSLLPDADGSKGLKTAVAGGLAALLLVCGVATWTDYCNEDETAELREITAELTDMGYEYGYSGFWDGGNVITELSNGQIDMYVGLSKDVDDIDWTYKWLQRKSHDTQRPDGPVFVLFKDYEMGSFVLSEKMDQTCVVYYSDKYTVFGYDSYDEMKEAIAEAEQEALYEGE